MLGRASRVFVPTNFRDDDEDPDYEIREDEDGHEDGHRHRATYWPTLEPQKTGSRLLMSGEFGRVGQKLTSRHKNINVARLLLNRGTMPLPSTNKEDIMSVGVSLAQ